MSGEIAKSESWSKRLLNIAGLAKRKKPAVGMTPADEIFRENKWRLLRYRPRAAGVAYRRPVLLVPSLINRHYVLDLMPGKSFAEWMVARGHDVYVVDWGTPGDEDRFLTFDEICDGYLGRAIRRTSASAGDENVHLLGYCLGGTFTTIHAAAHPEKVATLVDIAAPISFDDDGLLCRWTQRKEFDLSTLVSAFGNVPWPLMQATFHMLRPTLNLAKGVYMIDRAWDDEFLDGFFALETWGSDNVSFPGEAFRKYIEELYQRNSLVKGEFRLSGERVDLARIACPLLNVTFEHDNIVPAQSAAVLMDLVSSKDKERLHLHGGHVGAVVSKGAAKGLWPKISEFWARNEGATATSKRANATSTSNISVGSPRSGRSTDMSTGSEGTLVTSTSTSTRTRARNARH